MRKRNIVKRNIEFDDIIKQGKLYKNRYYAIYIINKKEKFYRFGIAVSKKIGKAVTRNKIKRQIKNIIDKNNIKPVRFDSIIVIRGEIVNLSYKEQENYLIDLLSKINEESKNEKECI